MVTDGEIGASDGNQTDHGRGRLGPQSEGLDKLDQRVADKLDQQVSRQ